MRDKGRHGETRSREGGHTIQQRHTCGETRQGETRPREGRHTIQHRHTCGDTQGEKRGDNTLGRRTHHPTPRRRPYENVKNPYCNSTAIGEKSATRKYIFLDFFFSSHDHPPSVMPANWRQRPGPILCFLFSTLYTSMQTFPSQHLTWTWCSTESIACWVVLFTGTQLALWYAPWHTVHAESFAWHG